MRDIPDTATIRLASIADAQSLSELAAETFPLACPPFATAEDIALFIADVLSPARFEEYLTDPGRVLFVAETDRMTGYAMLVTSAPADPEVAALVSGRPTAEVSKMYVLPSAHGTGPATELMQAAFEAARAAGARSAWLGVNQLNERAQRFYRKCGFEIVGTKSFWVGHQRHDDYVMERTF
ncbi:GNAT family N-acetyltransferase [Smaragdicoccus niigatensis]|uniref:GNAT family N-acetyltransferase n=1 Tax=Smaragdicoccus niigatensis TaxID=359359 RepID=UPI0003734D62|nr:GNAT family N-acetyltransferase [Smaragdicoccus niigatensis]